MNDHETDETSSGELSREADTDQATTLMPVQSRLRVLLRAPGLIAISLYMMVLAGIDIVSVVSGEIRPVFLVLAALWIAAGLGLLMLLRWAWAVTTATIVLLVSVLLWRFSVSHQFPFAVQGLLSLTVFLYLIRTSVREKLR